MSNSQNTTAVAETALSNYLLLFSEQEMDDFLLDTICIMVKSEDFAAMHANERSNHMFFMLHLKRALHFIHQKDTEAQPIV